MFLSLLCLTLAITGYRKGNVYDMDSFSRNNYVIVGSRTLHCEPPQVYQPTPDPPPPGEETLMSIDIYPPPPQHPRLCVLNNSDSVCIVPSCMETSFRSPPILFSNLAKPVDCDQNLHHLNLHHRPPKNHPLPHLRQVTLVSLWLPSPQNQRAT